MFTMIAQRNKIGQFVKGHEGYKFWSGKKMSDGLRKKLSIAHKGKKLSKEHVANAVAGRRGYQHSEETKAKIGKALKGRKYSEKSLTNMSLGQKKRFKNKKNHPNWRGGITPESVSIRNSKKYEEWRGDVFSRDKHTCRKCGQVGGSLEAHHIKSFANYPDLRFELENGITYCERCHSKVDLVKARFMPVIKKVVLKK